MRQRPWRKAVYWLCSCDFLSLLSYTTQAHLPRGGTIPSGLGPSPGQSDEGIFSIVPFPHMTLGHCRNPKTYQQGGQQQDRKFLRKVTQNRRKVLALGPTHRSCVVLNKFLSFGASGDASIKWERSLLLGIVVLDIKSPYSKNFQLQFL